MLADKLITKSNRGRRGEENEKEKKKERERKRKKRQRERNKGREGERELIWNYLARNLLTKLPDEETVIKGDR